MLARAALSLAVAVVAAFTLAATSLAAPSDLDSTFGKRGVLRPGWFGTVTSLIALPDGRYLGTTGGLQRVGGPTGTLFALRPDGGLDTSFGPGGRVDFSRRDFYPWAAAFGVLRQPGDRFVVWGGSPFSNPGLRLVRYMSDGALDRSFGSDGRVEFESGYAGPVVARPDGSLVGLHVTCAPGPPESCTRTLFALTADGHVDETFGTNGAVPDVPGTLITSYPDGRIALARATPAGAVSVVRYTANGLPDPQFGRGGVVLLVGPDPEEAPGGMLARSDGKLIVLSNSEQGATLTRLTPDGAFDRSFGFGGRISVGKVALTQLALQRNGKLLVAGRPRFGGFALFRVTSDGRLDTGFGQRGRVFTDPTPRASSNYNQTYISSVTDVVVDRDGKIVLTGGEHPVIDEYSILLRYRGGRSVSPSRPRYSLHIRGGGKRLQVGETIRVGLRDRLHRNQSLEVCGIPINPPPNRNGCVEDLRTGRRTLSVTFPEAGVIELRLRILPTGETISRTLRVHRR